MTSITEATRNEIAANVAEKVAYLKSIADDQGYDVAAILRNDAAYLRTKTAAHNHVRADLLDAAADEINAEQRVDNGSEAETVEQIMASDIAGRFDVSRDEAERIAGRAANGADWMDIWENETWWRNQ